MDEERNMASCSFRNEEWLACLLGRANSQWGVISRGNRQNHNSQDGRQPFSGREAIQN